MLNLASVRPCVIDHGAQGSQSLAQELSRGVSGSPVTVNVCVLRGWGEGLLQVSVQEQEALGPWASIPHMLWEGAENWLGVGVTISGLAPLSAHPLPYPPSFRCGDS